MWSLTEHEKSQWRKIQQELSEILGRNVKNEIVTDTIIEFINLYKEKVK